MEWVFIYECPIPTFDLDFFKSVFPDKSILIATMPDILILSSIIFHYSITFTTTELQISYELH